MIDAKWNRERKSFHNAFELKALYDHPMTIQEILTRKDGLWQRVSDRDRIWVWTRFANQLQLNEWLARLTERALTKINVDPRSLAVIVAIRKNNILTKEIVDAAHAAAVPDDNVIHASYIAYLVAKVVFGDEDAVFAAVYAIAVSSSTGEATKQIQDALELSN